MMKTHTFGSIYHKFDTFGRHETIHAAHGIHHVDHYSRNYEIVIITD
uniref:Uncharacterized protein n=1 Tax=Erwinia amylovora ATCC BAA-2158 TaxID=889211 RepID=E5B4Q6_ERWAM|nr:hypothetical protein predicted by Glimmer/Critica [Erwinia amylovora ATCC BAA-2158]